jgi:hypothetical protein
MNKYLDDSLFSMTSEENEFGLGSDGDLNDPLEDEGLVTNDEESGEEDCFDDDEEDF